MSSIKILLSIVFFTFLHSNSHSQVLRGNDGAHGGDELGLEFKSIAFQVLSDINKNYDDLASLFPMKKAFQTLNIVKVYVVDRPLRVQMNSSWQESIAVNMPDLNEIYLNRGRWSAISKPHQKAGIALHEILSLMGIERTGVYSISSQYLSRKGIHQDSVDIFPEKPRNIYQFDMPEFYLSCRGGDDFFLEGKTDLKNEDFHLEIIAYSGNTQQQLQEAARQLGLSQNEAISGLKYTQRMKIWSVYDSNYLYNICQFSYPANLLASCGSRDNPNSDGEITFYYSSGAASSLPVSYQSFQLFSENKGLLLIMELQASSHQTSKFQFRTKKCN